MKRLVKNGFQGLMLLSLLLACMLAFAACGDTKRTVSQPQVYDVTLSVAEGQVLGTVGVTHTLSYKATEGSDVTVTAMKNGVVVGADDFAYTAASKTIVFKTSGQYTVLVTATKDTLSYTGTVGLTVFEQGTLVPVVEIGLTKITINTPMPLYTVRYSGGAAKYGETIAVEYKESSDGTYAAATADTDYVYSSENGTFTAKHGEGTYRVTVQITDTHAGTGSATKEITARAVPEAITVLPADGFYEDQWNRVPNNAISTLGVEVVGDASEYEVVATEDSELPVSATATGLSVTTSALGTYTVGVTFKHRGVPSITHTLTYPVQVVDSVEYSPVFGADPFGGTYDYLIPSTGLMLYHDTYMPDGQTPLTYANITYSIAENNIVDAGNPVTLMNAGGNVNFPFVIVQDFESNDATGTLTVKMVAEYAGYTAAAYKTFTMTECGKKDGNDNAKLQAYYKAVAPQSDFILRFMEGNSEKHAMEFGARQNSVITNNGIIAQRDATWGIGCIGFVNVGGSSNCQLDFKLTRLKGAMELGIGLRTGNWNGWSDYIRIKASSSNASKLMAEYDTSDLTNPQKCDPSILPNINDYGVTYMRIKRASNNTLTIEFSDDGDTYYQVFSATLGSSRRNAIYAFQFDHSAGNFALEDVKLTKF